MANQQLLNYIKQQLQQGVDKEMVKKSLIAQGWQLQDVEEAFSMRQPFMPSLGDTTKKDVITAWGKVWRFLLGFSLGGFISFPLSFVSVLSASFALMYVAGWFYNLVVALSFFAGIVVLIALTIPIFLFFRLRSRKPYFSRGILAGSISAVIFLFGIIFYGVVFWGWGGWGQ